MKNNFLVSVVVPFFNTPPIFLKESIDSVLCQSYPYWELLLVDDGSNSPTTEIARTYEAQFPGRIRYLEHKHHQNRGASASRNLGINNARGELIALLDADDLWLPHKLKEQVAILRNHPTAVMVYGATQYWYNWTANAKPLKPDYIQGVGLPADKLVEPPKLLVQYLKGQAPIPCICSVVLCREALDTIGLFEDSFPDMYDDQVFYTKICLRAPVFVSNKCWDKYRQHPDSLCAIATREQQTSVKHLAYLRWFQSYLHKEGFEYPEVWQSLQRELRFYEDPSRFSINKMRRYLNRRSRKLQSRISANLPFRPNRY